MCVCVCVCVCVFFGGIPLIGDMKCGQSKDSGTCNTVTGVCPDGCDPGWTRHCNGSKDGLMPSFRGERGLHY